MQKQIFHLFIVIVLFSLAGVSCSNSHGNDAPSEIGNPPQVEILPEIALPDGYGAMDIVIEESPIVTPESLEEHYIPIGKVYDIELANEPHAIFTNGTATLHYTYDKEKLWSAGLIEDFMVYYFDDTDNTWKQVDDVEVNKENSEVIAYTSHFTPFILTALADPWILVGGSIDNSSSSNLIPEVFDFFIDGTVPYITWYESSMRNGYQRGDIFVKYWNGKNWVPIGNALSEQIENETIGLDVTLTALQGKPTVGFLSGRYGVHVVQWNGTEWKELGNPNRTPAEMYHATAPHLIAHENTLYLAWVEFGFNESYVRVSRFDGAAWVPLGEAINDPLQERVIAGTPKLAFCNGNPSVAYINNMHSIIVKSWNGSEWVKLSAISSYDEKTFIRCGLSFAFNDSIPYLAWSEIKYPQPETYGDWVQEKVYCAYIENNEFKKIGESINEQDENKGSEPSLFFIKSKPYVAYCNYIDKPFMKAYVKCWDGTKWEQLGDSLNVEQHYARHPVIQYNGSTFFVAFVQNTRTDDSLYVKAGNWNEPFVDGTFPQPQITKFVRTSSLLTNSRTITLEADGYDDKRITHWMITGTDVKPLATNFNWQSEKPIDCDMLGITPGQYSLYLWAKDENGNVSDMYPPITVEIYGIALESASRQSHGVGYFGDQGRGLAKKDYPNFSPIAEGVDFTYDKALDNSDGAGYSLYDTAAFDYTAGKGFRIIENGENVAAEEGLHLTPLAKNLSTIQSPPENQVYIDPLRGVFVLPRPLYWSRMESFENVADAEIPYGPCTTTFTQVGVHPGQEIMPGIAGNGLGILYNYPLWSDSRGIRVITISNNSDSGYTSGTISFWTRLDADVRGWQRERERTYARCTVSAGNPELFRFALQTTAQETIDGYIVINGREASRKEIDPINTWEHVYIIWSRNNPGDLTRLMVYINGVREFSIDTPSTALLIHDYKLELEGTSHMSLQYVGSQTNIAAVGMSSITVDNLKIWNHVVGDPGNHSRWLYDYEQTISDDALHAIYSRENGYRPVLDSDRNSGVGYYPIQAGK